MKILVIIGLILIALGLVGVIQGGFTYTKDKDTVDLGFFEVVVTDKERVQIHPALGVLVLAAGLVVLAVGMRRPRV